MRRRLERAAAGLRVAAGQLDSLSPLAVLGRGYAIARREPDGRIVRRADEVGAGDALSVRLADGEIHVRVEPRRSPGSS